MTSWPLENLAPTEQRCQPAALRLRTNAAERFKKVENATAVIWKMLLAAEKAFRRLNEPDLAKEVYLGVTFVNGEPVKKGKSRRP